MKNVVIIGAGPAGLTAAYTLLKESKEFHPIIVEESEFIGGISRTAKYGGNRIDIGGHRFFSKDAEVMELWKEILPLQGAPAKDDLITGREHTLSEDSARDPEKMDEVFLSRTRVSRIYYRRRFFDYPISLKPATFVNMGLANTIKAGCGYLKSSVHKLPETSLENFYINRFGRPLYQMFFEDYTTKLWGVHPSRLSADWGAQRVKGLSVSKVIMSALSRPFRKKDSKVETSLIEEFYYPKYGPGQLWETMAERNLEAGAEYHMQCRVVGFEREDAKIRAVLIENLLTGERERLECDFVISSMPIKNLAEALPEVPKDVLDIATALPYRDFMTVGLLLDRLELQNKTKLKTVRNIVPDCWIYIQERDVKVGRLQIFNNWSPYMVDDMEKHVWVGMEYFCNEGDSMWNMESADFIKFATSELVKIGIIKEENVIDSCHIRVKKAYPAYFGIYEQFDDVKKYLNTIENLFCVGRNGQHRYNNMDHSMVTAMRAARQIMNGHIDKECVWNVNTEQKYHETANAKS